MRKIFLAAILSAPWTSSFSQDFSTSTMRNITLDQACSLSLAKSEQLAVQGEYLKQLDAAENRIKASFRPSLDFNASVSKEQNSESSRKGYLSAGYRLFSGMRDYLSLKAAAAKSEAGALDLENARQRLCLDAAAGYLDLLMSQEQVFIRLEQITVDLERIKELRARAEIGRSRASEVLAAKTQLSQDKALYLDALVAERLAQQVLMFLTGLTVEITPAALPPQTKESLETYLKNSKERPDIKAKRKNLQYYSQLLDIELRNYYPSVDLSANYYLLREPAPVPQNRWNAGITLNLPLYSGGVLKSQKDSSGAARRAAELELEQALRQAETEVRSAYEEHVYRAMKTAALLESLNLAAENALYQQKDYKLGLVTNLDVLSALNSLEQAKLSLSRARSEENFSLMKLKLAAGREIK